MSPVAYAKQSFMNKKATGVEHACGLQTTKARLDQIQPPGGASKYRDEARVMFCIFRAPPFRLRIIKILSF